MSVNVITLESLLDPMSEFYGGPGSDANVSDDPAEIAIECMDIMSELSTIEQNIISLEAGKAIKKAKSASKKTKIVKTKMKAKYAKAKKAGGKVKKIKKVTKEGDAELDGGTGPTPTTSDTNGLTDTDLDADPDAEVEVTETVDTAPNEEVVGTEGVDFIVEYEDTAIVTIEATLGENLKSFGDTVVKFIKKVGAFFVSIFKKFVGLFQNTEKFVDANKAAINAGLKDPNKTIKTQYRLRGSAADVKIAMDKLKKNFDSLTSEAGVAAAVARNVNNDDTALFDTMQNAMDMLFEGVSTGETKIIDSGFKSADDFSIVAGTKMKQDFEKVFNDGKKALAEYEKNAIKATRDAGGEAVKEKLTDIRKKTTNLQKAMVIMYKCLGKVYSYANKVSHAAVNTKSVLDTSAK